MNDVNPQKTLKEQMLDEVAVFATRYSVKRLRISTLNFEFDYVQGEDGSMTLAREKAVIYALGKVTKVPIGEGCEFSTYEEAEKATKKYWSEYYKNIRASRSEKDKLAEARRQKRYREKRKEKLIDLKRQQ